MASRVYSEARKQFAMGDIKWRAQGGDTIKAFLLDELYQPSVSSHKYLSDISQEYKYGNNGLSDVASSLQLTLLDPEDGVCNAISNLVFNKVTAGKRVKYLLLFKDTGDESTSPLICFSEMNLTTTNGGNLAINFDTGPNKIFKL